MSHLLIYSSKCKSKIENWIVAENTTKTSFQYLIKCQVMKENTVWKSKNFTLTWNIFRETKLHHDFLKSSTWYPKILHYMGKFSKFSHCVSTPLVEWLLNVSCVRIWRRNVNRYLLIVRSCYNSNICFKNSNQANWRPCQ